MEVSLTLYIEGHGLGEFCWMDQEFLGDLSDWLTGRERVSRRWLDLLVRWIESQHSKE
jgi:hypothetical protein